MKTQVIYEDEDILVVHKPAGIATQTARVGQQDVVSELKNYLAKSKGTQPYLGIVHRLDQPVEGLLVFAKSKQSAAALAAQLSGAAGDESTSLNKHYYGIFCGKTDKKEQELVDHLYKDPSGRAVVSDSERALKGQQAKRAVLRYRVLQEAEVNGILLSLADIQIETGRFHQIRAQMAHGGMCLLGDLKYGNADSLAFSKQLGVRYVALCAYEIEFLHPIKKEKMSFRIMPCEKVFSNFQL